MKFRIQNCIIQDQFCLTHNSKAGRTLACPKSNLDLIKWTQEYDNVTDRILIVMCAQIIESTSERLGIKGNLQEIYLKARKELKGGNK